MRKWFRLLGITVLSFAALFGSTLSAYATCTSSQQEEHIYERYYKDLDLTDDVLTDQAFRYVNNAYIYVDTCDADKTACVWERQVPFPVMKKGRANDKKYYFVYRIRYWFNGDKTKKVWKYGIGQYKGKRMKVSVRECVKANAPGHCSGNYVVKKVKGWSSARSIEASLVMMYTVQHGHCPPGQRKSCT